MIPAPRIGSEVSSRTETMAIAHDTRSSATDESPLMRARTSVAKNVTAPASLLRPSKCKLKIAIERASDDEKSTPC